jgi:rhodanese-related sulfurtransferase
MVATDSARHNRKVVVRDIERDEVRRLMQDGAQIVEVLPTEEYTVEHLPGAISLPLRKLNRETAAALNRERPIVTYCYDRQ